MFRGSGGDHPQMVIGSDCNMFVSSAFGIRLKSQGRNGFISAHFNRQEGKFES